MATPPNRRPPSPLQSVARGMREASWVIALGVIAACAFFVQLRAWHPGDVVGVSIAVGVLVVLWIVHAWTQSDRRPRRPRPAPDRRARAARLLT
jgi:hypothetical protein